MVSKRTLPPETILPTIKMDKTKDQHPQNYLDICVYPGIELPIESDLDTP